MAETQRNEARRWEWVPEKVVGLTREQCTQCGGTGLLAHGPCHCVLRAICRACLERCDAAMLSPGRVQLEINPGGAASRCRYGRSNEEFRADVALTARRVLSPPEWNLFRLHFMQHLPWKQCCQTLRIDRGAFYHAVYRVESKLGRAFAESSPYALWPIDEYFGQHTANLARSKSTMCHPLPLFRPKEPSRDQ